MSTKFKFICVVNISIMVFADVTDAVAAMSISLY